MCNLLISFEIKSSHIEPIGYILLYANRVILKYGYVTELKCNNNVNCINGGKCVEDFPNQDYKCTCSPEYTGRHCESGEYSHVTF